MTELLQRYGYTYDGKCNCDGFPTEKFKQGDYQLRLRQSKNLFKIKQNNRSLTLWTPTSKLPDTLQNIHQHVAVQT